MIRSGAIANDPVAEEAAQEVLAEGEEGEPEVIGEKKPEGESEEKK